MRSIATLCFLLTLLFACSGNTDLINEFVASMPSHSSEMEKMILQEFITEGNVGGDLDEMKEKFEVYKKEWVERMVDYMLKQLDINEEGAKEARKHP